MSRHPIVGVRSNQHLRSGRGYVFSRDCLEVELSIHRHPLHLFVNHFKSMLDKDDPRNGRRTTRAKRQLQARTVKEIVQARLGQRPGGQPFIVLGDLNDYLETDDAGKTGISELVEWDQLENVVERRPEDDRWTCYFSKQAAPKPGAYQQLDYLLLARSLAEITEGIPEVVKGVKTPIGG